jgi:pyruvate dehydrogenase E2 component (dihydrolipoamide acetyltransferase)
MQQAVALRRDTRIRPRPGDRRGEKEDRVGFELRLPDVGEGIAEGEVVKWLVNEGASVNEDDLLVEVLTDKANVEIPSPVTGILSRIMAPPGRTVKVGEVLAYIETSGERPSPGAREDAAPPPSRVTPPGEAPGARSSREGSPGPRGKEPLATPAVRKLAKNLGVDLSAVHGTGPDGRVTEEDVRRPAGPEALLPVAPRPDEERIPFRGKRRMAARWMALSKTTVPHALLVDEADATALLALRERIREVSERERVKITILPFIVQAVVTALRLHPALNASLDEIREEIVLKKHVDIGIAVDVPGGLVVPVVRDAGGKTIVELAREIERLTEAVRAERVAPADLGGGTFTITSIGSIGGLFSYPVINAPEAGILAVHKIVRRPVIREGEVAARDMMYLSLSFDHRIVDGGAATRFMNDLIRQIEAPDIL